MMGGKWNEVWKLFTCDQIPLSLNYGLICLVVEKGVLLDRQMVA